MVSSYVNTDILDSLAVQLPFITLSIALTIFITSHYLNYMIKHLLNDVCSDNTFRKALVCSIVNNIPKILLIMTNLEKGIERHGSLTNGISILNMTLCLPLIILNSNSPCYMQIGGFIKDLGFIEIFYLIQYFEYQKEDFNPPVSLPTLALIAFFIFLFTIFRLPEYFSRNAVIESPTSNRFETLSNVFERSFGRIYDLVIIDLEDIYKFSGRINWKLMASPFINALLLIAYFRVWDRALLVFISLMTAFFIGILLIRASKTSSLSSVLYLYGIVASLLHMFLFLPVDLKIVQSLALKYNLNLNYLLTIMLPILVNIGEMTSLVYFSSIGNSTLSISSIVYSNIINLYSTKSVVNLYLGPGDKSIKSLADCNHFCHVFGIVFTIVILFNYTARKHKLSRDLAYVLLFTNFFFNLSYVVEFNTYIRQSV